MATLPQNVGFATNIQYVSQPTKTWIINRQTNRVQTMDDALAAMRQAVEIILNVERFRWQIYTDRFGSELEQLLGDPAGYIESELPRLVTEALTADDRVVEVVNFAHKTTGDIMSWSFDVHTVFGTFGEEITI